MIFGSQRDFKLFNHISRELLRDVIEQEILYYKFSLQDTISNMYGESLEKTFLTPAKRANTPPIKSE